MYQAIAYKEWIKTRRIICLLGLIFAAVVAYLFIETAQDFRILGAVGIWSNVIMKDISLIAQLKYLPWLAGVLLSLSQFLPEVQNKRLKLTLHLPLQETSIIANMLIYGLLVLLLLFALTLALVLLGLQHYFPSEILGAAYWSSIPWFLAGFFSYLLTTWICIEPVWKQRIGYAFAGISGLSFFFISALSGAYSHFIYYLLALTIFSFTFSFYTVARFKEGVQ